MKDLPFALLWAATVLAQTGGVDWKPLLDGKSLGQWKETAFERRPAVRVEEGAIVLTAGQPLTGITWAGEFPKSNYEIRFEAARMLGGDFFPSVTFPAGGNFATWVLGGWGGDIVGIRSRPMRLPSAMYVPLSRNAGMPAGTGRSTNPGGGP